MTPRRNLAMPHRKLTMPRRNITMPHRKFAMRRLRIKKSNFNVKVWFQRMGAPHRNIAMSYRKVMTEHRNLATSHRKVTMRHQLFGNWHQYIMKRWHGGPPAPPETPMSKNEPGTTCLCFDFRQICSLIRPSRAEEIFTNEVTEDILSLGSIPFIEYG
jgi:transposase